MFFLWFDCPKPILIFVSQFSNFICKYAVILMSHNIVGHSLFTILRKWLKKFAQHNLLLLRHYGTLLLVQNWSLLHLDFSKFRQIDNLSKLSIFVLLKKKNIFSLIRYHVKTMISHLCKVQISQPEKQWQLQQYFIRT